MNYSEIKQQRCSIQQAQRLKGITLGATAIKTAWMASYGILHDENTHAGMRHSQDFAWRQGHYFTKNQLPARYSITLPLSNINDSSHILVSYSAARMLSSDSSRLF